MPVEITTANQPVFAPDPQAVLKRSQATWGEGDFSFIAARIVLPRAAIVIVEPLYPAHHLRAAPDKRHERDEQEAVPEHDRDRKRVHCGLANTILTVPPPRAGDRKSSDST